MSNSSTQLDPAIKQEIRQAVTEAVEALRRESSPRRISPAMLTYGGCGLAGAALIGLTAAVVGGLTPLTAVASILGGGLTASACYLADQAEKPAQTQSSNAATGAQPPADSR